MNEDFLGKRLHASKERKQGLEIGISQLVSFHDFGQCPWMFSLLFAPPFCLICHLVRLGFAIALVSVFQPPVTFDQGSWVLGVKDLASALEWEGDKRGTVIQVVPRDPTKEIKARIYLLPALFFFFFFLLTFQAAACGMMMMMVLHLHVPSMKEG